MSLPDLSHSLCERNRRAYVKCGLSCQIYRLNAPGLKKRPMGTPVIFITAKGTLGDRVRGLNLGADDYIVKPFEVAELVARVESCLLYTSPPKDPEIYTAFPSTRCRVWPGNRSR